MVTFIAAVLRFDVRRWNECARWRDVGHAGIGTLASAELADVTRCGIQPSSVGFLDGIGEGVQRGENEKDPYQIVIPASDGRRPST